MTILIAISSFIESVGTQNIILAIGAILTYLYWLHKKGEPKRQEFRKFTLVFTPTLHRLDDIRQSSHIIIHDDFSKHRNAMLKFIASLNDGSGKNRFKAKWNEYEKNTRR
ncbi:MAG: hypothetical protein HZC48_00500 [Nitrospirae bacterium]|nr:hypothetical protein [Nitrospirota bacterium]